MRVLAVYAHPSPKSFCHAILQQFTTGLEDAGHVCVQQVNCPAPSMGGVARSFPETSDRQPIARSSKIILTSFAPVQSGGHAAR